MKWEKPGFFKCSRWLCSSRMGNQDSGQERTALDKIRIFVHWTGTSLQSGLTRVWSKGSLKVHSPLSASNWLEPIEM